MRLVELWKICPPTNTDNPALAWTSTTLEQEEQLARMRYERQTQQEQQQQQQDTAMNTAPVQTMDGLWQWPGYNTEPYMMSGYQELMRREYERQNRAKDVYSHFGTSVGGPNQVAATDPVYKGQGSNWQSQMQMENQYGAFEQSRRQSGTADAMEIL
jgi:hypothetical protein